VTEEPKQKNRDGSSRGTEQKFNIWVNKVTEVFFTNPTLVLSLLYFYVTGTGIFYAYQLYFSFGINIFDYAAIVDFLLAAFKTPRAFGLVAFTVAVATGLYFLYRWMWMNSIGSGAGRVTRTFLRVVMGAMLVCGFYIFFLGPITFAGIYALDTAQAIQQGKHPSVDVRYTSSVGSADQVTEPGLVLIGATQRAYFFYDVKDQRTLVIPQSQVVSIEVPLPNELREQISQPRFNGPP
jgi:hypothetical protein